MQHDFPSSESCTVEPAGKLIITRDDQRIGEEEVLAVDNSFLTMFSLRLLPATCKTALKEHYSSAFRDICVKRSLE